MTRTLHWIEDLWRHGFRVRVECKRCGHRQEFEPEPLLSYFRKRRWATDLSNNSTRFRCTMPGCGHKGARMMIGSRTTPKPRPPKPVDEGGASGA